jgi:hypothetical protein
MGTTTFPSRVFHQDSARVKRAAQTGPVVITDRGEPSLLIQKFDQEKLALAEADSTAGSAKFVSLYDVFSKPHPADDIELELPERTPYVPREIDW